MEGTKDQERIKKLLQRLAAFHLLENKMLQIFNLGRFMRETLKVNKNSMKLTLKTRFKEKPRLKQIMKVQS
jgi:hypothetical protein